MKNWKCATCGLHLEEGFACVCGSDMAEPIDKVDEIHTGCHAWSVKLSNIAKVLRPDDSLALVLKNAASAFASYGGILYRNQREIEARQQDEKAKHDAAI